MTEFELILETSEWISKSVKYFVFRRSDNAPFLFIPGQYVVLRLNHDGQLFDRQYSLSHTPTIPQPTIEIGVTLRPNGQSGQILNRLQSGDKITARGPFGRFVLPKIEEGVEQYELIGTGTGINPYRAMLPEIEQQLKEHPQLKITLAHGIPDREHLLYHTDFLRLAEKEPRFQFQVYYSNESAHVLKPFEHKGLVLKHLEQMRLSEKTWVYLCGNLAMIQDAMGLLEGKAFPIKQIKVERFTAAVDRN